MAAYLAFLWRSVGVLFSYFRRRSSLAWMGVWTA